jgi:hypothetical protein
MPGSVVPKSKWFGLRPWARVTLQLAIYELQYVLQDIVMNKIISNNQLILVFLMHFSVALA